MAVRGEREAQVLEIKFDGYSPDGSVPWATISSTVDRLTDTARAIHTATSPEAPPLRIQLAYSRNGSIILALIAETLDLDLKWVAQNVIWDLFLLVLGATIGKAFKKPPTSEQRAQEVLIALKSAEVRKALSRMLAATTTNGENSNVTFSIPGKPQLNVEVDQRSATVASAALSSQKSSVDVATSEHVAIIGPGSHDNSWVVQWRNQNRETYVRDRKLRRALEKGSLFSGQILFVELIERHHLDPITGELRRGALEIRRLLYPKRI